MSAKMKQSRILLICPDSPVKWPVGWLLTRLGHQVHVAVGGEDGVDKAGTYQFDVVVLQDPLPEGDAWEVFYRLDGHTRHRTLILVGERDPISHWERRFPEAREVLPLPDCPEELAAVVCELLITETLPKLDRDPVFPAH